MRREKGWHRYVPRRGPFFYAQKTDLFAQNKKRRPVG